jgi:hypothetical protein
MRHQPELDGSRAGAATYLYLLYVAVWGASYTGNESSGRGHLHFCCAASSITSGCSIGNGRGRGRVIEDLILYYWFSHTAECAKTSMQDLGTFSLKIPRRDCG